MARSIQAIVEEQVAKWRLQADRRPRARRGASPPANVMAISHAIGSFGSGTAQWAGVALGIPVYDREVMKHIAASARIQMETVQTLDERAQSVLDDYLCSFFRERGFDQNEYVRLVCRTIAALWAHGPAVLVGRGAIHIIPRHYALNVRITAPWALRVRRVAGAWGLTIAEAERKVRETDRERTKFHRRFFGAAVDDPLLYDLVINTAELSVQAAGRTMAGAYLQKFAQRRARTRARAGRHLAVVPQPEVVR